jgi:hypothetical protein
MLFMSLLMDQYIFKSLLAKQNIYRQFFHAGKAAGPGHAKHLSSQRDISGVPLSG